MHQDDSSSPFVMTQLPDTPDSRLFVELSSYAADLVEAREALELSRYAAAQDLSMVVR